MTVLTINLALAGGESDGEKKPGAVLKCEGVAGGVEPVDLCL